MVFVSREDPWAASFGDLASLQLERCLGAHPISFDDAWTPPVCWDASDTALEMPELPNIWTDGSREDFSAVGGFEVAGAGVYLPASELAFDGLVWGYRLTGLVIHVLTTLMLLVVLVVYLILIAWLSLCLWSRMVI